MVGLAPGDTTWENWKESKVKLITLRTRLIFKSEALIWTWEVHITEKLKSRLSPFKRIGLGGI
jgi:hypothetical protein